MSALSTGSAKLRPLALVRRPGVNLAQGLVTHIDRSDVDLDLARKQWEAYVQVFSDNGWTTVEVAPEDACPDAAFIEDTVVLFGDLAVVTRPGAKVRRAETAGTMATLVGMEYDVDRILAPGTLDGGDVLKVEVGGRKTAYVGLGSRTNQAGFDQLVALVASQSYRVVAVPTTKVLHLKSAVTALPDGTIIGFDDDVDDPTIFDKYLSVPEASGAHVVHLGRQRLLMAADCPKTSAMFRDLGYTVVTVDISEFVRLEGCVTCLSVRSR